MHTPILIAFGANIAPETNLAQGIARLHALAGVRAISTVYRTRALADPERPETDPQPDFLNGALRLAGAWDPWELRTLLKSLEQELGRNHQAPGWRPRPLDLDIALMGSLRLETPILTIPDPDIPNRSFLALPLAELAPKLIHPVLGRSLTALSTGFAAPEETMRPDPQATARLRAILPL
ncbi:MAG: 2-amino-4-hydroxy-6-hydroxymethyldihydropteridine diphosphokinase [Magnetococcales bacterium]|nr:2-amino-4-hydroxy-6-hydroxymethyldihydropteridine diphosphokinase [Magnetococcales bacterium]